MCKIEDTMKKAYTKGERIYIPKWGFNWRRNANLLRMPFCSTFCV
jgi:hypothetical protein